MPSPHPVAASPNADASAVAILNQVASALNEEPDVAAAMNRVLPRLTAALGLHTAWMFLFQSDGRTVAQIASTGLPPALAESRRRPLRQGTCFCQDAFRAGHLTRAVNIVECSRLRNATGDTGRLVLHASVPLTSKAKPLGILNVASPGRDLFGRDVLAVLSAVGQQVAVAVERTRLYRDVDRRAVALTGLQEAVADLQTAHSDEEVAARVIAAAHARFGARRAALWLDGSRHGRPGWHRVPAGGRTPVQAPPPAAGPVGPDSPWHPGTAHPAEVLPLSAGTHVIGVLSLVLDPRDRDRQAALRPILHAYATHIALALANADLLAETERLGALEERQRLARELHDAVSQELFSSTLTLAAAERLVAAGQAEGRGLLTQGRTQVQHALAELRALVYELAPPDDDRLAPALHRLAEATGAHLTCDAQDPDRVDVRRALYRIAQEAVHNALRHAPRAPITMRCTDHGGGLSLAITDTGPGFTPGAQSKGLGLRHMRERADAIGARLTIASRPGAGTTVQVDWRPPDAAEEEASR